MHHGLHVEVHLTVRKTDIDISAMTIKNLKNLFLKFRNLFLNT